MPEDTELSPHESNAALVGVVSPWIDLGSSDPLIAHISRQVFHLEIAYAAFCGINNVLVHGPIQGSNATQYSRAIMEAGGLGPYIQLQILMSMSGELELEGADGTHLSELTREQYSQPVEDDEFDADLFDSWEIWNTIRTICNYSTKLTIGKSKHFLSLPSSFCTICIPTEPRSSTS
jgi:protein arginine N-methyltransferase 5